MKYTLSMVFTTAAGEKITLSIPGVKSTITQAEVDALMDTIIAKNIFVVASGSLTGKSSAQLVAKDNCCLGTLNSFICLKFNKSTREIWCSYFMHYLF